jgi:elongation factor Ts
MAQVTMDLVRQLRDLTGAGMMDCKRALEESEGDLAKALLSLREKGIAKAAKRAGRETANGVVESYLHETGGGYPPQNGALVELNCETDFVAKGEDFRRLARELAMQIVARAPRWISRDDVPPDVLEEERELLRRKAEQEGKPAGVIDKIVAGGLDAFLKETCLLEQPYIRDDKTSVRDLVAESVAKLQENITVRRFARFNIKEA